MRAGKISFSLLAIILSAGHFLFLICFLEPSYTTPDANGYFVQARTLAENGQTKLTPESALQYIGPHWHSHDNQHYYTTFPPGFSFLLALFIKLFGYNSAFLVNPFLASLTLFIFFSICRFWMPDKWALMAACIMALNPFANEHALFCDSHTSLVFFLLSGLLLLLITVSNYNFFAGLLSGICIGIVPTIRYAEILLVLAFAIYVLLIYRDKRVQIGTLVSLSIGILIPLILLATRNQFAFGSFLKTGYNLPGEPAHFGINYLLQHFLPFIIMLILNGAGLMFFFGILGIYELTKTEYKNEAIFFLSLIFPVTLLYMAYFWQADQQSMRFLIPTFFFYTLAGVRTLSFIKNNATKKILIYTVIIITVIWGSWSSVRPLIQLKENGKALSDINDRIKSIVPEQSVIITNEGINQFLDYYGKWDLIDISILIPREFENDRVSGQDFAPKPIHNRTGTKKYIDISEIQRFQTFYNDLSGWTQRTKNVYLVGYEPQIDVFRKNLLTGQKITILGKIRLQEIEENMPPPPRNSPSSLENPGGRNRIFDLILNGRELLICEISLN